MSEVPCFWHGVEVDEPDDYRSCFECGHIWRTEADWRADCERIAAEISLPVKYELTACPLCAHDL